MYQSSRMVLVRQSCVMFSTYLLTMHTCPCGLLFPSGLFLGSVLIVFWHRGSRFNRESSLLVKKGIIRRQKTMEKRKRKRRTSCVLFSINARQLTFSANQMPSFNFTKQQRDLQLRYFSSENFRVSRGGHWPIKYMNSNSTLRQGRKHRLIILFLIGRQDMVRSMGE